jgi:hypothetical protein
VNIALNSAIRRITTLAEIDPRIPIALRSLRDGSFSYIKGYTASDELTTLSKDLGYPSSWGNLALIPADGTNATAMWKELGVRGRNGIGGIPCELVHGGNGAGNSCIKNVVIRGSKAWLAAIAIYLPVRSWTSLNRILTINYARLICYQLPSQDLNGFSI